MFPDTLPKKGWFEPPHPQPSALQCEYTRSDDHNRVLLNQLGLVEEGKNDIRLLASRRIGCRSESTLETLCFLELKFTVHYVADRLWGGSCLSFRNPSRQGNGECWNSRAGGGVGKGIPNRRAAVGTGRRAESRKWMTGAPPLGARCKLDGRSFARGERVVEGSPPQHQQSLQCTRVGHQSGSEGEQLWDQADPSGRREKRKPSPRTQRGTPHALFASAEAARLLKEIQGCAQLVWAGAKIHRYRRLFLSRSSGVARYPWLGAFSQLGSSLAIAILLLVPGVSPRATLAPLQASWGAPRPFSPCKGFLFSDFAPCCCPQLQRTCIRGSGGPQRTRRCPLRKAE